MEWFPALGLMLASLLGLMAIGLPIAFAFFAVNIVFCYVYMGGEVGIIQFLRSMVPSVGNFSLTPLPLFILMGEVMFVSGMASRAINAMNLLIRRVPGRLSVVAIGSGTLFSSVTGSSLATVAMLGASLVPEMKKRGYSDEMSAGPILATGGLAALIPPSGLAIILGSLGGIPITGLLIGGIVPGLLLAALFILYILLRASFSPSSAPGYEIAGISRSEQIRTFTRDVLPLALVLVAVVGSMLTGIATVTESAAIGVLATLLLALSVGRLGLASFANACRSTTTVTVILFIIIAGSTSFAQLLSYTGASQGIMDNLMRFQFTPTGFVLSVLILYVILGCFIDPIAIMMLTIPILVPMANHLQIDLVWFGVLLMIALELGFITPPFGLSIFVLKGVMGNDTVSVLSLYRAVLPFLILQLAAILIFVLWPAGITGLSRIMGVD